ncbi:MAG: hypothetical protein IJM37_10330 [Lachnospiraceae bacterium]|nr:hypothetical protein [Lachnospiraceae bacterium]
MSAKTKIVVLRMKEIIYTVVFIVLAILLIILFVTMFRKKDTASETSAPAANALYNAGIYSASITLNNQNIDLEVTVDSDYIKDIKFVNLDDSVATMYPLMETTLDNLSEQIIAAQNTASLEIPAGAEYTSRALINVINSALAKAEK